ncbi:putative reverse transcriptase domain-containing protein [Tanacetum coccineum]
MLKGERMIWMVMGKKECYEGMLEGSASTYSKSNWRIEIRSHFYVIPVGSMSPPIRRKYRASVAFATGCKRINKSRRCNRKIRVPIAMWPCKVEEKMTLKEVDGKTIQEFETKIIAKDGTITRVPGTFQGYETSEEESVERPRKRDLYEFVDHPQLQQRSHRNEFAPRRLSQPDGNMNGWLLEDEDEVERNEVDFRTSESTGKFAQSNEMAKLVNEFWNHKLVGDNHRYITGLAPEIRGMLRATQPTTILTAILRAGILTDEAVSCGTLTKGSDKRKGVEEPKVADGKKVEVDRVIRDCKLELGSSLFSINLIPLGHGSFDVIIGMDWLSQHKAVIVCHDKVVEIPVEDGRILRVHGERAVGITKALKSAKEDEPKLNDIPVVREFEDVFPEDLSGLPPQ